MIGSHVVQFVIRRLLGGDELGAILAEHAVLHAPRVGRARARRAAAAPAGSVATIGGTF